MVVTKLTGGLGNQMFQYAFGVSLSAKLGVEFRYDFFSHPSDTPRSFELNHFAISSKMATKSQLANLGIPLSKKRFLLEKLGLVRSSIKLETGHHFQPDALNFPDNSYVQGYWQSEKYFNHIESTIRQEFTFKRVLEGENKRLIKKMNSQNAVSVHIRHGDYLTSKAANEFHGVCGLDYYQAAIQYMNKGVTKPIYYFFSDDPAWVKKNLLISSESYYIDWNQGEASYIDMQLMSHCQHHIIANSSFSWWGAWLNPSKKKIVIAPKQWFKDPSIDTSDLIPDSWIRL